MICHLGYRMTIRMGNKPENGGPIPGAHRGIDLVDRGLPKGQGMDCVGGHRWLEEPLLRQSVRFDSCSELKEQDFCCDNHVLLERYLKMNSAIGNSSTLLEDHL